MRPRVSLVVIPLLAVGCAPRFKSWESFVSATTPNPPAEWKGDEYADAGYADSSGGLDTRVRYPEGARNLGQTDPGYDQPAKGTGNQRGEATVESRNGHGKVNAPAFQPTPGDVATPGRQVVR